MATAESLFIDHAVGRLQRFSDRITTCLSKLSGDQIWMRGSENQNAVGNLVLHLSGNVRQWIISGLGGAEDRREREAEFTARGGMAVNELAAKLKSTVDQATEVIRRFPQSSLTEHRTIQGYDVTVLEAIFSVVEHFSGHTAQIIFITKALTGEDLGFYSYLSKTGHAQGQTAD